jgi:hypothetical protein
MSIDHTLLALVVPLVLLQMALLIYGLYDLTRPGRRVRGDNPIIWALDIVFVDILGPILYFLVGRKEV